MSEDEHAAAAAAASALLSGRAMTHYILSLVPVECLPVCARVCKLWRAMVEYLVPLPLCDLRPLTDRGELLYLVPASELEQPRSVLLKLHLHDYCSFLTVSSKSSPITHFSQSAREMRAAIQRRKERKRGIDLGGSHSESPDTIKAEVFRDKVGTHLSTSSGTRLDPAMHEGIATAPASDEEEESLGESTPQAWREKCKYYRQLSRERLVYLSEILFVTDGHWTPTLESLDLAEEETSDEQFFQRRKCLSIVSKEYDSIDLVSFNESSNQCLLRTLRRLLGQSSGQSQRLAIFAKANHKYIFQSQMANTPVSLSGLDPILLAQFPLFVATIRNELRRIKRQTGTELSEAMYVRSQLNAEQLFAKMTDQRVSMDCWASWVHSQVLEWMAGHGLIAARRKPSAKGSNPGKSDEVGHRRKSSLFDSGAMPADLEYPLFQGHLEHPVDSAFSFDSVTPLVSDRYNHSVFASPAMVEAPEEPAALITGVSDCTVM